MIFVKKMLAPLPVHIQVASTFDQISGLIFRHFFFEKSATNFRTENKNILAFLFFWNRQNCGIIFRISQNLDNVEVTIRAATKVDFFYFATHEIITEWKFISRNLAN
jgi:hypothetical protein